MTHLHERARLRAPVPRDVRLAQPAPRFDAVRVRVVVARGLRAPEERDGGPGGGGGQRLQVAGPARRVAEPSGIEIARCGECPSRSVACARVRGASRKVTEEKGGRKWDQEPRGGDQ